MGHRDFLEQAHALSDQLIAWRRDLHRHPELAFEEHRTAGIVASELNALGLEVQTGVGRTGVVALLDGPNDGPTVLVRADMDALPVQEANTVDYASTVPGKMHACGHDGHTAILLGVARILTRYRDQIAGRVKFVFQPAEETGLGAKAMIEDGVLRDPRPDVSLGLHLWNSLPLGTIGIPSGPIMAGASIFDIRIVGKGGHAAIPDRTVDPLACAAQVITALQTIVSRGVNPLDPAVFTIASIHAGHAYNVIPDDAHLKGTFRYFRIDVRDQIERRMRDIVTSICAGMGCQAEITVSHQTNPVMNDPAVAARLREQFEALNPGLQLEQSFQTMGAEDVSFFMTDIPGTYFFVGARDTTADAYYGHHHARFNFDEGALPLGAALLAAGIAAYVMPD